MSGVDRTPRDCSHKRVEHQHGTHAAYVLDRCRCVPCRDSNTAYERHRNRQIVYGRWEPFVSAAHARCHVLDLMRQGLGLKRIAKVSGVPHGSLTKLIYGGPSGRPPSGRIRPRTHDRLLAIRPDLAHLGSSVHVDAIGTRRRLQALIAAGWSQAQIARRIGMTPGNFGRTLTSDLVRAGTARAVIALYAELADSHPPQATHQEKISVSRSRNRARARARGWLAPAWWDDDTLDLPEPDALPVDVVDVVAVERAIAGEHITLTPAERAEAARRMSRTGATVTDIARALRLNSANAHRYAEAASA